MEPWISWPIFIGLGATAYFYYTRPGRSRSGRTQGREAASRDRQDKGNSTPTGSAEPQGKTSARVDSSQGRKRKQPKEQPANAITLPNDENRPPATSEPESETDDQAWAKQLQAAKHGVSMKSSTKSAGQGTAPKSTKQRDAGNLSSHESGEQIASAARIPASQDVSDMLEPAPAGPSAIRITGEEKPRKQTQQKEEPAKESKKQRQNRKKAEERKAFREEDEKERRVLEEKQRRTAREARGEPAKNGMGVAQPSTSNAWSNDSANKSATSAQQMLRPHENPLLDIFDQDAHSTTSSNDPHHNIHTPATAASTSSQDLLSEEAQMDAIKEMNGDSGWNEVKKPKKGKKKAPGSPPVEPGATELKHATLPTTPEVVDGATKAPGLPVKKTEPGNNYAPLQPVKPVQPSLKAHPDDSDWAVE